MNKVITSLVNNTAISSTMFILKERWMDEQKYEDINEYKKAIVNTIKKQGFDIDETSAKATKRPFGVKVKFRGSDFYWHIFVKAEGIRWTICAKFLG